MSELLAALQAAITSSGRTDPIDQRLRSVLGRRLLELLRAETIDEWLDGRAVPTQRMMLETLASMEMVRESIEPDCKKQFADRLSGLDGLTLAVEIAHDLRSPLTSVLFLAETLQRGMSGAVNKLQQRQLGLVYSSALALSEMVSNVIELARGGNSLADEEPTPFAVSSIFEAIHDMVRPMAEEKGLAVRLLPPASDHRLGNPEALSRVLLNLTTNALKFTEEGFVEIVAREQHLRSIEFSVRDTGPGIRESAIETLYAPFRRAGDGPGYRFSGTGLGLSLSRHLVEAMGSELQVETRAGWGTRFYFDLDLSPINQI